MIRNEFDATSRTTIGVNFSPLVLELDQVRVRAAIWDTGEFA
jgi:GTPase SAR1 family protein